MNFPNSGFETNLADVIAGRRPVDVSGCVLWLASDTLGLSEGAEIETWPDLSGNALDATQVVVANRPFFEQTTWNNKGSIYFDNGDGSDFTQRRFFNLPSMPSLTSAELYWVGSVDNDPPFDQYWNTFHKFGTYAGANNDDHYPFTDGSVYAGFASTSRKSMGNPSISFNGAELHLFDNWSVNSDFGLMVDNQSFYQTATNTFGMRSDIFIGADDSLLDAFGLRGYINEMFLMDAKQSSINRTLLSIYTAFKWALSGIPEAYTITRDTGTFRSGVASEKIVASAQEAGVFQSFVPDSAGSLFLSAYVYTNGSAVTSADCELFYNGVAIPTTYSADAPAGWYKLLATVTGSLSEISAGVHVKANKTIYVDDLNLVLGNVQPNTPTNVSPADTATDVGVNPVLQSSAFSDPDIGNTHLSSQWQVATDVGFTDIVFNSGITLTNLISIGVTPIAGSFLGSLVGAIKLQINDTYYWRVRHRDNQSEWSSYSTPFSFTTIATLAVSGQALEFLASHELQLFHFVRTGDNEEYEMTPSAVDMRAQLLPASTEIAVFYPDIPAYQLFDIFIFDLTEIKVGDKLVDENEVKYIVKGISFSVNEAYMTYQRIAGQKIV